VAVTSGVPVPTAFEQAAVLLRALRLEYLTIGWNVVEGIVARGTAIAAGSLWRGENSCGGRHGGSGPRPVPPLV
jgi:hypothetical protein